MKHTTEEYRFLWNSSFDGEALVHISRGGKNIIVDWSRSSYTHGTGRFWTCIDMAGWDRLAAAVTAAGFWGLEPYSDDFGLDGASWTFEGRCHEVYRVVRRWSPGGAIYDLGRTFLDLAGPPIAYINLY